MLGFNAVGTLALGQIGSAPTSVAVLATFSFVGVAALAGVSQSKASAASTFAGNGAASGALSSKASASMSATGTGAFTGVLSAKASSSSAFTGSSGMTPRDQPGSVVAFGGIGTLAAVGYALVLDAEQAGPPYELKIASVEYENNLAVAPAEDRVYYVPAKVSPLVTPNRKRFL